MNNENRMENFIKSLPHGSGFDCEWEHIKTQVDGKEVFQTYYHNMNYHGYYEGYTKIKLIVDMNKQTEFRISLSEGKRKYMDYNNRSYYEDTIYNAIEYN